MKRGVIQPSGLAIEVPTRQTAIQQVRIVPHKTHYTLEVIYEQLPQKGENLNPAWYAGLDIGLDNLATITANKLGFVPLVVNGRPLKSINQYYNRRRAALQARLGVGASSKRLGRLTDKRNRRVHYELHLASRRLIERLVQEGIGTLIIGKNDGWKQASYLGRRVHRGLFISARGRRIQADVNGSYNIIRKAAPCAFDAAGVEGAVVRPVRLALTKKKTRVCGQPHH